MPVEGTERSGPSRRRVLKGTGTALTVGTMGVAGCLGNGGGSDVEPVGDELTVWHAMGGALGETIDQIGSDFQDETDIEVNMEFQDSYENVLTNFLGAIDTGEVPDLIQADSLFAQQVLDTDAIEPVENILPDDFPVDSFLDNVTSFFQIDDSLASLPFNNSNTIMYYNRDAFEEGGLDPDDPPSTLAEVRDVSETLVDEGVVEYGITWPNHVWFVETWYAMEGELIVSEENGHAGDPTEFQTPDAIYDLYEWWKGMADDGLYSNPGIEAWDEANSTFLNQNAAIMLNSTASVSGVLSGAQEQGFQPDAAPYPGITDTRVGPVIGGASFYASAGLPEDRLEEIGQLLQHMASPEVQVQWHQGTGYYPIREEAVQTLEDEGWFEENPMYSTALDQLQAGDTEDPATLRMLLGPARQVQTEVQDSSVDIFNADDIDSEIEDMKSTVDEELSSYYE